MGDYVWPPARFLDLFTIINNYIISFFLEIALISTIFHFFYLKEKVSIPKRTKVTVSFDNNSKTTGFFRNKRYVSYTTLRADR